MVVVGDVTNAFLQGSSKGRQQPIFMLSPKDPILTKAGALQEAELFEIEGNVYGLANAPNLFSDSVREKMAELGFMAHSLDVMLFMRHEDRDGIMGVVALVLFHVDDMIATWDPEFDSNPLFKAFDWGPGRRYLHDQELKWNGKQIQLLTTGSIRVHQRDYAADADLKKIPSSIPSDQPLKDGEEMSEFRSCAGSLQWLSGHTRIDLAAGTSLTQRGSPEIGHLREMYRLLEYALATKDHGIVFNFVPFDDAIYVGYGDSSWANAEGFKSQLGSLVIFTTTAALKGSATGSIHDHKLQVQTCGQEHARRGGHCLRRHGRQDGLHDLFPLRGIERRAGQDRGHELPLLHRDGLQVPLRRRAAEHARPRGEKMHH